jgi:hypothetical protein
LPTLHAVSRRAIGLAVGLTLAAGLLGAPIGVHAAAANCKLALQSGQASPASGTTETQTTFSVRVSWKANCDEPDAVTFRIQGLSGTIALSPGPPSTAAGTTSAVYSGPFTIGTPGSWSYEFAAREGPSDPWVTLAGSSPAQIDIAAVPPTPTPTPKPKPKPTATPTPKPKPKPKPTATPAPEPTARPRPTPTREPESEPAAEPTPATPTAPPPESSESSPRPVTDPPPSFPSAPAPTDEDAAETPVARTAGGVLLPRGPDDPPGPDVPLAAVRIPSGGGGFDLVLVLLAWVVSASAGSVLFAFTLRRRADRNDEATLAFAAGMTGSGLPPTPLDPAAGKAEATAPAHDPEALIPRWRRPSLQAARQSSYAEAGTGRPPLRFEAGVVVGALRVVAYRLVFVSDRPSDYEAVELGRLDRGDHVDLLRIENGFALVKAPDGMRGWVEAATLETPGDARPN